MTGDGVTEENIAPLLHFSMPGKTDDRLLAMDGALTYVQRQLIRAILNHIDDMTKKIEEIDLNKLKTLINFKN